MAVFYYTDLSQEGDPFVFVVETDSVVSANKSFNEQTGLNYYKESSISCELFFDQILEIPGEHREQPDIKRCKHNQDISKPCGACSEETKRVLL